MESDRPNFVNCVFCNVEDLEKKTNSTLRKKDRTQGVKDRHLQWKVPGRNTTRRVHVKRRFTEDAPNEIAEFVLQPLDFLLFELRLITFFFMYY